MTGIVFNSGLVSVARFFWFITMNSGSYSSLQKFYRARREGQCMFVSVDDIRCQEDAIDSHSIQRSGPLREISEKNHVYFFTNSEVRGRPYGEMGNFQWTGIKKASTFPGYCRHHDSTMFRAVEAGIPLINAENIALLLYRNICRQIVGVDAMLGYGGDAGLANIVDPMVAKTLRRHKKIYEKRLHVKDFTGFSGIKVAFGEKLPFCSADCFPASYTLSGDQIPFNQMYLPPIAGLFCGTLGKENVLVVGGFCDSNGSLANLLSGFSAAPCEDLGDIALNFCLCNSDNTYFSPRWLDSRSADERELMSKMFINSSYFGKGAKRPNALISSKIINMRGTFGQL